MRSLTPCAPAGSPPHRLAGHRHEGTSREWPRPVPCTCTTAPTAVPAVKGQTCHSSTTVSLALPGRSHSCSSALQCFRPPPAHRQQGTRGKPSFNLFTLPASPRGCPRNKKLSLPCHQGTFPPFCPTCCGTKPPSWAQSLRSAISQHVRS